MACQQLGFASAENATTHSHFGPVETPLMIGQGVLMPYYANNIKCNGTEAKLSEWMMNKQPKCQFGEAAGVVCRKSETKRRVRRASPLAALRN